MVNRRRLLQLGGLSALGLPLLPLRAKAADGSQRQFLILLAYGGWDPAYLFASTADHPNLPQPLESEPTSIGDLHYVVSHRRPWTRDFFNKHADRICIVNGLEVPSITHEQCRRLILTGAPDGQVDDWSAILGGNSAGFDLPTLVVDGPAYANRFASAQLRVGPDGQLPNLADGSAFDKMDQAPGLLPSDSAQAATQAWLAQHNQRWTAPAGGEDFAAALARSRTQVDLLHALDGLDLAIDNGGMARVYDRFAPTLDLLAEGVTRCVMGLHLGQFDANWDTHAATELQSDHFEFLFEDLMYLVDDLEGLGLLETTTVVVLSEMGRAPAINKTGGKDHWTFTSAMLLGSGVRGGQVIGGYDSDWFGVEHHGRTLSTADLGATLLSLGDVDPAEFMPNGRVIEGLIE